MPAEIRIGTSGWHYKHWVGSFYPPKTSASKMLGLYIQCFDTVELNNSFYRLPPEKGLANWRDSTPPDFRFAVKGSRFITHMKKLKDPEVALERFFERADILNGKLGTVLWQLPPQWELNLERFEHFLEAIPKHYRHAFEFRNATWHTPEVYRLPTRHGAAFCPFDLDGYQSPVEVTTDFAYIRLHGPGAKYQGSYSDETLAGWTNRIKQWIGELRAVYVYFDNDQAGFAPHNALRLREMLRLP
jgi:uncharacterized protein YecE (DUF72 family)